MAERTRPVWDQIASDDYIAALGRVVYEANRLELVAADKWYHYAHMAGLKPHERFRSAAHAMTMPRPVAELLGFLQQTEPNSGRVTKDLEWAEQATDLLRRRHEITHVVYVRYTDSPVLAMYVNRDGEGGVVTTLDDPEHLLDLASEIHALRQAGERSDIPGVEEMLAEGRQPEPGRSWVLLVPGTSPLPRKP